MLTASITSNCIDIFMLSLAVGALSERGSVNFSCISLITGGGNRGLFSYEDSDSDVFYPIIVGYKKYELNVFNKYGELLFISKGVNMGWNGYY